MPFPKRKEIEIAILVELNAMGGEAKTQDIYPRVAQHFPEISAEELVQRFGIGENRWANLVRWARLMLVAKGEVASSGRGIWRITDKGRERIGQIP